MTFSITFVAASAISVGVVQGLLTLLGALLGGLLPAALVSAVTATGGVLLLGVGLRLLDGSTLTDNVTALRAGGAQVLVQTDGHHVALMSEAVSAGARGIVFKHQPVEQFLTAVTAVGSGESYLSVELASLLHTSRTTRPQLTAREVEVLTLLYAGMVSKQVARQLDLAESTIKEHLKRIRGKYAALGRPVGWQARRHAWVRAARAVPISRAPV